MSGLFSQELAIETAPLDLLHGPSVVATQRPKRSQIKKLCGEITIGTGELPRFGAYAEGGILLSTKCLTSASLVLISESQNL